MALVQQVFKPLTVLTMSDKIKTLMDQSEVTTVYKAVGSQGNISL